MHLPGRAIPSFCRRRCSARMLGRVPLGLGRITETLTMPSRKERESASPATARHLVYKKTCILLRCAVYSALARPPPLGQRCTPRSRGCLL